MVVTSGYESRWGNLSVREIGLGMRVLFCPGKVFGFWWLFVLSFNLLHVRGFHMRQKRRSQPTTWVHEAAGTSLRALACKSSALLTELSPSPPAVQVFSDCVSQSEEYAIPPPKSLLSTVTICQLSTLTNHCCGVITPVSSQPVPQIVELEPSRRLCCSNRRCIF